MEQDCGFTRDSMRFRYRAAAIIIEKDCVLLASNESADYYYSVGGGVHHGETAEEAVRREVFEETGMQYEIERLAFIHENFFTESSGCFKNFDCHEISFYFLMKRRNSQELNSDSYCADGREFMNWIPISDLKNVKSFPTFFSEKLGHIPDRVEHIVTREEV